MMKIKNISQGFLLVEVLVAIVILGAGLTIGMQALMYTVRMNNLAYQRSIAILLADSHLSKLLMLEEKLPENGSSGQLDDNFNWEIKKEEVNENLEKIIYAVWWKEKYSTPRIELVTYHNKLSMENEVKTTTETNDSKK